MKKLILSELLFIFLATTFMTDTPNPGWYQVSLPINKYISDIYFLDSLTGWSVTAGASSGTDTGYVLKTTNGGNNWQIQNSWIVNSNVIQFLNQNTGFIGGGTGFGKIYKTTNGGQNWNQLFSFGFISVLDLYFYNQDTGWVCTDDPLGQHIFKTTNGGQNWTGQLTTSNGVLKLFFINKDTGWAGSNNAAGKLYRTTNGGLNWNVQYISNFPVEAIFFLNPNNGWIRGGTGNGVMWTIDGGFTFNNAQGNAAGGHDIKFINDSIGYSGCTQYKIPKSTDGGKTWGYQISPIIGALQTSIIKNDTLIAWMASVGMIKTTDGGGQIITSIENNNNNETPSDFTLYQNYPNPFNPVTVISYQLVVSSFTKLRIYDILGKEIVVLSNIIMKPGIHKVEWDGTNYPSGVYFYQLLVSDESGRIIFKETKKMLMIK
jgi:photosystem II stability/assembly factor-like uncharacterized protein